MGQVIAGGSGSISKKKLAIYYKELQRLSKAGPPLTTEGVLQAAKAKSSPLHDWFDWDNRKAADKYRLHQAQQLITTIRIVYAEGGDSERAFYNAGGRGNAGKYYESGTIQKSPALLETVIEKALRELDWWSEKYAHLDGLDEVAETIRKITASMRKSKLAKSA